MTLLVICASIIGAISITRLLLGEFSRLWYEDVENSYTTCDNFHATMAAKPRFVRVDEWLTERGI